MTIRINDKDYGVQERTSLLDFLHSAGLPTDGVAIALMNCVIPRAEWNGLMLEDGMDFIMIHAVSGG
jgi:thiamine biosynthesis protein ThiS